MPAISALYNWAPVSIAFVTVVLFIAEHWAFDAQIDDAFIFYRYAQHLVDGDGFVFNVGERVEGVTSLLWTLLIAGGIVLGGEPPHVAHWLGVASGAVLLWGTYRYATLGLAGTDRIIGALSAPLLYLTTSFSLWSTSGLETPLFAGLATALLIADAKGRFGPAVTIAVVATLVRPEGVLLVAALFGATLLRTRRVGMALVCGGASYAFFLASLTAFRLWYFGDPLPNTFYAKVGGLAWWSGPYYVLGFVVQIVLPAVTPARYAGVGTNTTAGILWLALLISYAVLVGGDVFSHGRLLLPALPVVMVLVTRGTVRARERDNRLARLATFGIPVCAVWFSLGPVGGSLALCSAAVMATRRAMSVVRASVMRHLAVLSIGAIEAFSAHLGPKYPETTSPRRPSFGAAVCATVTADRWTEIAKQIEVWQFMQEVAQETARRLYQVPPSDKTVATTGVGALGYYSNARIIDILGLVDRRIAKSPAESHSKGALMFAGHQRSNARYVLRRKPDFILIPERGSVMFHVPAVRDLYTNREFRKKYLWDFELGLFRRRSDSKPD